MKKILLFFCAMFALSAMALTYNVTVPAGTNACYIAGDMNGWSHQEMTKVDATHYTIDIASANESQGYKYCSGPGWDYVEKDANGGELSNRTYNSNDVVAKWNKVYEPSAPVEKPEGNITIYLEKATAYSTTYLYAWEGADLGTWPGMVMTQTETVGTVEYWKHTFVAPEKAINIIFNDGAGNQTNDITGVNKTTFYRLNSTSGRTDVTVVDPGVAPEPETPETLVYNVTVPAGTSACYIVGEFNGWDVANATKMDKVDDNRFTVTINDIKKSTPYKYVCAQSWDYVECLANGDEKANRTWSENDIVEAWRATVEAPGTLTYNVTVPGGTPACYIAGEMNGWTFSAMEKIDETHYTITFDNVTRATKYKYTCGDGWDYVEVYADGNDVQDRTYHENDVVEGWKSLAETPEEPGTLIYNVTVPDGTPACYIAGEMTAWSFIPMQMVDDTHYTITLMGVTKSMKYKYTCGTEWDFVEMQADGVTDVADRKWSENDVVEAWKSMPQNNSILTAINNNTHAYGINGAVRISTTQATQVAIYNAQGILVNVVTIDGEKTIELARGMYIVNNKKVLVF